MTKDLQLSRLGLFPTNLYASDDTLDIEDLAEIHKHIMGDYRSDTRPEWQSQRNLHKLPVYKPLVKVISITTEKIIGDHDYKNKDYEICEMWSDIYAKGESNKESHVVKNKSEILSGIYFIDGPQTDISERIDTFFHDPRPEAIRFAQEINNENGFNSTLVRYPFIRNRMVMCPSYLTKSVEQNNTDQLRITVAFNIRLKDA